MKMARCVPLAAGALALALMLPVKPAAAVTLPGVADMPAAAQGLGSVEKTRTVCRRYWNGYRWRTRCWWVPGRYEYWGPRPWRRPPPRYRW